jgi:hypothetical protein
VKARETATVDPLAYIVVSSSAGAPDGEGRDVSGRFPNALAGFGDDHRGE